MERRVEALLRGMLIRVRRSLDTPLQFGIDSAGIVASALTDQAAEIPQQDVDPLQDWESVKRMLNAQIEALLQEEQQPREDQNQALRTAPDPLTDTKVTDTKDNHYHTNNNVSDAMNDWPGTKPLHPLAEWLERLYATLRDVHPRALEIAALRIEDFQNRAIAERLGLGLRLVKRIVHDMRLGLRAALERD